MKRHTLELISTKKMTREEWLIKRGEGIGGSDVGTILGLNKNFSKLELFHQKCGITLDSVEMNQAIFWGNELEAQVRDAAQYLDLESGDWLKNAVQKQKLRTLSEFKYMVRNPKLPWLLANIDALEDLDKRKYKASGIGEIKTISRQSAEMWETFPPYHYMQVMMYHLVLRPMLTSDVSKIFYLRDGRDLYGYEIPYSQDVADRIIEETFDFWERVKEGRQIVAKYQREGLDVILQALINVEPATEPSNAYEDYLSRLFKLKNSPYWEAVGDEDLHNVAMEYQSIGKEIKKLEADRTAKKTKMLEFLRKRDAGCIVWEDHGSRVTFNKRMYVNIKG